MKKALSALLAAIVLFGGLSMDVMAAAYQQSPSKNDTLAPRTQPVDGSGRVYQEDHFIGYKVFENSNSTTGVFITDEAGNKPTSGMIHQVCVSPRQENLGNGVTEYVSVYETATLTALSARQPGNLAPMLQQSATATPAYVCQTVDAQFNNTVNVWNSGTDLDVLIYWAPSNGANSH